MTIADLNPQAKQMADESMVRTLAAQAQAIWPQEAPLFGRYVLPARPRILDAGCGTGEVASRLAELFPDARVDGVDVLESHLDLGRSRYAHLAPRLSFARQSVYELAADEGTYDLTVCRHVIHAIPQADRVIAELVRVTRRGGYLHLVAEDYGMLHFQQDAVDLREFWHTGPARFAAATGTDLFIGRNIHRVLASMGLQSIAIEYLAVDTLRVPRETLAAIFAAWRDGYAEAVSEAAQMAREHVDASFDQMLATIRDPLGYAVWLLPVVSARRP